MIGQWVRMCFYDIKNSVYQALIWIRPGYEASLEPRYTLFKHALDFHTFPWSMGWACVSMTNERH